MEGRVCVYVEIISFRHFKLKKKVYLLPAFVKNDNPASTYQQGV